MKKPKHNSKRSNKKNMRSQLLSATSAFAAMTTAVAAALLILIMLGTTATAAAAAAADDTTIANPDALGPNSVIVITGAAGFIGSELAMALYHTYAPKKLILIDSMDKGFGGATPDGTSAAGTSRSDQDLALFEFKRQRIFHVLQTVGATGHFYRMDLRPSIPEYYDAAEVPALAHIFEAHPDITHVVHLADHYHGGHLNQKQWLGRPVVPRVKNQPKAGLMEAVLEQVRLFTANNGGKRQPHVTYASSYQVYKYANRTTVVGDPLASDPRLPPFVEETPITATANVQGTAKLLDELLAQTYHEIANVFSIGLRYFEIYGPWGLPGSPIFEMAERIVAGESPMMETDVTVQTTAGQGTSTIRQSQMDALDNVRDYLYIDDAIDATMSAMQLRPTTQRTFPDGTPRQPPPIVINVGSGNGVTLRQIAKKMVDFFPGLSTAVDGAARPPTSISYGSSARAQQLLGFFPQVPMPEGLEKVMAWHYDRAFPYGAKPSQSGSSAALSTTPIANKGIVACNKYDTECLKGTPVFPCASECAHETQCLSSFWDDVVEYTKALTSGCSAVMYTIALEEHLKLLPSTVVKVSAKSKPFVEQAGAACNVAFVSETSELYRTASSALNTGTHKAVTHGFWSLIPVRLTDFSRQHLSVLRLLPKLSPGRFFGLSTRHAIYCDPSVIFHSIPRLLFEASMQPYNDRKIHGQTTLLLGKRSSSSHASSAGQHGHQQHAQQYSSRWNATRAADQVQEAAYRMIRIAVIQEMTGDGFALPVDSSFLVHALAVEDSRLFRCDVYGEVVQWNAATDMAALEFTMGLHDMWSRVIAKKSGLEPWWIGDQVKTVDQDGNFVHRQRDATTSGSTGGGVPPLNTQQQQQTTSRRLEEVPPHLRVAVEDEGDTIDLDANDEPSSSSLQQQHRRLQAVEEEDESVGDDGAADDAIVGDEEHNGFGLQDAARMVFGSGGSSAREQQQRHETPHDDDFDFGDDWTKELDGAGGADILPLLPKAPKDPSTYDVWMGILSSTTVRSFSRIVTMEAVGAMHIENYEELAYS